MLITNRTRGGGARSFVHSSKLLAREEEMLQETRQETDMEIDFNNNPDESIYEEEDSDGEEQGEEGDQVDERGPKERGGDVAERGWGARRWR